jgi:hypothetical protein
LSILWPYHCLRLKFENVKTHFAILLLRSLTASELQESDLKGQVHIVTGANTGLGYAAALALARRRASVHMLCRNRERGEAAAAELRRDSGGGDITLHIVDVSLVSSVKSFAAEWEASGRPLHCALLARGHRYDCTVLLLAVTPFAFGLTSTLAACSTYKQRGCAECGPLCYNRGHRNNYRYGHSTRVLAHCASPSCEYAHLIEHHCSNIACLGLLHRAACNTGPQTFAVCPCQRFKHRGPCHSMDPSCY